MSTKNTKKSDEDDQEYFEASHHLAFMVNCVIISHTCLLCLPGG